MGRFAPVIAVALVTGCSVDLDYLTAGPSAGGTALRDAAQQADAGDAANHDAEFAADVAPPCRLGSAGCPAKTCKDVKARLPSASSGVFTLDPDETGSNAPFRAYCELTFDGGGFTLVIKADGTRPTFAYDAPAWSTADPINAASAELDETEAKLPSFSSVPFDDILVGFLDAGQRRWLKLPITASSLAEATNGKYRALDTSRFTVGRDAWKSLLGSGSLQPNCNREGINVSRGGISVRIGIVSNNENDCGTPDSWIGIGGQGGGCGMSDTVTTGNVAGCGGDNGDRNTATFAYVLVR